MGGAHGDRSDRRARERLHPLKTAAGGTGLLALRATNPDLLELYM